MEKPKKPNRLPQWRAALRGSAAYYPVFARAIFNPVRLRGGEWGDVIWEGMKTF